MLDQLESIIIQYKLLSVHMDIHRGENYTLQRIGGWIILSPLRSGHMQ